MAFGLALTNFLVLYFLNNPNEAVESGFVNVSFNVTLGQDEEDTTGISVSSGQLFLWIVGGAFHSAFDLSIWHISACVCCQPGAPLECLGGCRVLGNYMVIFITILVVAAASFIVVLRAALDNDGQGVALTDLNSAGITDDQVQIVQATGIESYEFLISWLIEVATSLFFWYFVLGSVLFSGVLGCYTLPFLGGQPRDVKVEEWQKAKEETRTSATDVEYG